MPRWSADHIPWDQFDARKLHPDHLALVKAASLTESNAAHYTVYLRNVFKGDPQLTGLLGEWQLEEQQHGRMLGRYAELADPAFNYAEAFQAFKDGYVIPVDVESSVRGSRVGELQARCIVETGTSSFYTAMAEATEEPVLRALCRRIAGDEFRHYRMFLDGARQYQEMERVPLWSRLKVTIGRVKETDDDELAFAFHCGNSRAQVYDHARSNRAYARAAYSLYRRHHTEKVVGMIFKASGLNSRGWLSRLTARWAWSKLQARSAAV